MLQAAVGPVKAELLARLQSTTCFNTYMFGDIKSLRPTDYQEGKIQ